MHIISYDFKRKPENFFFLNYDGTISIDDNRVFFDGECWCFNSQDMEYHSRGSLTECLNEMMASYFYKSVMIMTPCEQTIQFPSSINIETILENLGYTKQYGHVVYYTEMKSEDYIPDEDMPYMDKKNVAEDKDYRYVNFNLPVSGFVRSDHLEQYSAECLTPKTQSRYIHKELEGIKLN